MLGVPATAAITHADLKFNTMNRAAGAIARIFSAWVFVCVVPLIGIRFFAAIDFARDIAAINTTIFSTIALILSLHISRQLFVFPGTRQLAQGIPAVFAGFAIVAGVLLLLRIQYSVVLLVYSLCATTFLMVFSRGLFGARARNNFHLVPFGEVEALGDLGSVGLQVMEAPELPLSADASIVADLRAELPPEWERLLASASLRGIPVYHFKLLQESIGGKVKIEHLSENTLGSLIPNQSYREVKWAVDRVLALIMIPLLAPFLIIIAMAIKLHDGESPIYKQWRVGLGGKPFLLYKFRSMSTKVEGNYRNDARENAITRANDARITPLGAFLRRYRIDELPQIFNILKGEMSFIGPRPEAIALAEWYEGELPFYSYRHIVWPGLTGWAQVNQGHVADLDSVYSKLQYDFYYVKYFSAWLDILIALRTIRTVLTGFGSK